MDLKPPKLKPTKSSVKKELLRRAKIKREKADAPVFDLKLFTFGPQRDFIMDESRRKTGCCSRRAGKTVGCAADLLFTAYTVPGITNLYITLSRKNAKRIIWKDLTRINKKFKLGGHIDNQELSITFQHADGEESVVYITGAKDSEEIEKFRGLALYKVYIDECQSFRAYISELVEDVIEPALVDYNGFLSLIGTPGPVCGGYFYDACNSSGWTHHSWTMKDNPFIEKKSGRKIEEIYDEILKRKGISYDDPTFQREYLGRWVQDNNALVYKYNWMKNDYDALPEGHKWETIFGIDIGHDDADAIAVLAYSLTHPHVFLVDEFIESKQSISDLADQIKLMQKKYDPVKMVMDAGALGKKIQLEIQQRHGLVIEAAEKARKIEFIELLNDDLRTSKLKIKKSSRCAADYNLIQWDFDKSTAAKRVISDVFHSDIADAVLYAWREARHYAYTEEEEVAKYGTNEYMDEMEREEAEIFARKERERNGEINLEPIWDLNRKSWWEQ